MASVDIESTWLPSLEESSSLLGPTSLAAGLYECSIRIFSCFVNNTTPGIDRRLLQRIRTQAHKFKLWGSNFGAGDGTLDERLSGADQLKTVLFPILVRMGETLTTLAERLNKKEEVADVSQQILRLGSHVAASIVAPRTHEDDDEIDTYPAVSLDDLSSRGSDCSSVDEQWELEELVQDLQSHNACLYGLGSVIQRPAERLSTEPDNAPQERDPKIQKYFENPAWPYISSVMEKYPSIKPDFARRLGEANERRYKRLQQKRERLMDKDLSDSDGFEDEAAGAVPLMQSSSHVSTRLASSEASAPSTQRSSVFDNEKTPSRINISKAKAPASVTTFTSSFGEIGGQKRSRGIPKMPDDGPWGTPFRCTVCGEMLSNIWSPAQWKKHVYQDLQPYVCSFPGCPSEHVTFASRHDWAEHESVHYRDKVSRLCIECDFQSSDAGLLQQHTSEFHAHLPTTDLQKVDQWISREKCPFCLSNPPFSQKQLVSHVGEHMREVAHAAIPISVMTSEKEDSDLAYENSEEEASTAGPLEGDDFHVPFRLTDLPSSRFFIDRELEIEDMERNLLPKTTQKGRKIHILYGLGGIGKTQLAIKFARKHCDKYTAIVWVNGKSTRTFHESLARFARRVESSGVPYSNARTTQQAPNVLTETDAILSWLALKENCRWLMIFDDVSPDPCDGENIQSYDVASLMPPADHGTILITTRLYSLVERGTSTEVTSFERHQALRLLNHYLGLHPSSIGAAELAQRLAFMPLALAQACEYMRRTGTSCSKYLDLYEISRSQLTANTPRLDYLQHVSIQTTWMTSYYHIQQVNATAANFVQLWAYLDNQDVWFELISRGRGGCPNLEWLQDLGQSKIHFKRTMDTLLAYSFIVSLHPESYSMRPLVHDWCTKTFGKGRDELVTAALMLVGTAMPDGSEAEHGPFKQRLLPHADQCIRQIEDSKNLSRFETVECYYAFHKLGLLYTDQGKLAEAESMYKRALTGYEKAFRRDNPSTLNIITNLGNLYRTQGRLAEAESMYEQALTGYEETLGRDHPSTLNTIDNLGDLYRTLGKLVKAESILQQALASKEKALGRNHISTLHTIHNLGLLYADQGKHSEAQQMYRQALDGYEKAWGPDHTSTLNTVSHLGKLYADQGKYGEAEQMYRRALDGYEKAWGPDHTSSLNTVIHLGKLYADQGKYGEAEQMYRRALNGKEEVQGSDH